MSELVRSLLHSAHRQFYDVPPWVISLSPNPPKRWALVLTPGMMMGEGRRTGLARFQ